MKSILFSIAVAMAGLAAFGQTGPVASDRRTRHITAVNGDMEALGIEVVFN